MTTTKRRTEITIEAQRLLLISRRRITTVAWCDGCAERVTFIAPDEAATLSAVNSRTIYRWIEEERLHYLETPEGLLLVCSSSLPRPGNET